MHSIYADTVFQTCCPATEVSPRENYLHEYFLSSLDKKGDSMCLEMLRRLGRQWTHPEQWILCSTLDSTVQPELTRDALERSLKSKENKNMREKLYFEFYLKISLVYSSA